MKYKNKLAGLKERIAAFEALPRNEQAARTRPGSQKKCGPKKKR